MKPLYTPNDFHVLKLHVSPSVLKFSLEHRVGEQKNSMTGWLHTEQIGSLPSFNQQYDDDCVEINPTTANL